MTSPTRGYYSRPQNPVVSYREQGRNPNPVRANQRNNPKLDLDLNETPATELDLDLNETPAIVFNSYQDMGFANMSDLEVKAFGKKMGLLSHSRKGKEKISQSLTPTTMLKLIDAVMVTKQIPENHLREAAQAVINFIETEHRVHTHAKNIETVLEDYNNPIPSKNELKDEFINVTGFENANQLLEATTGQKQSTILSHAKKSASIFVPLSQSYFEQIMTKIMQTKEYPQEEREQHAKKFIDCLIKRKYFLHPNICAQYKIDNQETLPSTRKGKRTATNSSKSKRSKSDATAS